MLVRDETVWLKQQVPSGLFAVGLPAIVTHLKKLINSDVLDLVSVVSILETTGSDGKFFERKCYHRDPVIAVGCGGSSYRKPLEQRSISVSGDAGGPGH